MAQFIQDSSTGSSDSSSSSSSGSESDLDFDVVRPEAVKFNEAGPEAEKETEGGSKEKKTTAKATRKNRQANTEKTQEVQKEKLTPERTVHLVKKIIGNYKKRTARDKKKFNKLLRSATATARQHKLVLNKVTKKST